MKAWRRNRAPEPPPAAAVAPNHRRRLGLLALGIVVGIGMLLSHHAQGVQARAQLERDGRSILDAAVAWRGKNAKLGCPTISQLIQDRYLPREATADDPWGQRYRIRCSVDDVHVESLGADGRASSDDDVRLHQSGPPLQG